ncbi:type II toxin-antitoxin system RelE/ParE family toxin [Xanthomonas sp. XNM01]|uniref:type II toxin-antitoxin system RelE/ParE family toxin n=1 Tax=Xanthomonas sp. XNM01 TaxID=2769289 RepID=UPI00177D11BE|nr:type II toxin-antitoxin system RelE/ParE family toxin [Xanthomonas sp. XNM01]
MAFTVRFTQEAREDLARLYDWLLQSAEGDFTAAESALQTTLETIELLKIAPLSCRKANASNPFLRELTVGGRDGGYVLLYEIEGGQQVTALAVRQQHESDGL